MVLPLFVIGMGVFIGMAGLALDMGHAYLNKTRLQNALDAAALSGAKVLNDTHSVAQATTAAVATFNRNLEGELAGLVPTVEVFNKLSSSGLVCTDPCYLRASVNTFSMPVWLARVLPGVGDTFSIGGSAVAGPIPIGLSKVCDIVPLSVCDASKGKEPDRDCSDGECFGYPAGAKKELVLKTSKPNGELGPGNFQLLEGCGNPGGSGVRDALAGTCSKCNDSMATAPGNKVGPVAQGLNTRFEDSDSKAPPDVVTEEGIWYDDYLTRLQSGTGLVKGGVPGRRIVVVPFIKCPLKKGGKSEVDVVGYGCFFLTRSVSHSGNDQTVYGQLIERCEADGNIAKAPPAAGGSSFNLHKIVLYQ
jgi:hypothetical protein